MPRVGGRSHFGSWNWNWTRLKGSPVDFEQRLRRITDLFVEGTEVNLGDDPQGNPVLIWVNKLNSFEVEEARRDGAARRGLRLAALADESAVERQAIAAEVALWNDEQLQTAWVNQKVEEFYLDAINDIETEEEWREKLVTLRRLPTLLQDAAAQSDDPRRDELIALQESYYREIADRQQSKQKQAMRDAKDMPRKDLERDFFEQWRQRVTLDEFMEERRITELFYALRACEGTRVGPNQFDHENCNHAQRALSDRGQVRHLPEQVLMKCMDALDEVTVPQREAGNSDAPASSSASSGPQSVPEASTPSTPMGQSSAPATT